MGATGLPAWQHRTKVEGGAEGGDAGVGVEGWAGVKPGKPFLRQCGYEVLFGARCGCREGVGGRLRVFAVNGVLQIGVVRQHVIGRIVQWGSWLPSLMAAPSPSANFVGTFLFRSQLTRQGVLVCVLMVLRRASDGVYLGIP